jgi:hypothetical protein
MPVKIFFAGAEGNCPFRVLNKQRVRQRLMSFFYLRKKSRSRQDELMFQTNPEDCYFLLDSGAFTIMDTMMQKAKKNPAAWWDFMHRYCDEYVEFIERYKNTGKILAAAELDVDSCLESSEIWYAAGDWQKPLDDWWNAKLANHGRHTGELGYTPPPIAHWRDKIAATGIPLLASWHYGTRDWNGWIDHTENFKYLGIGGEIQESKWFPYINQARKTGTYVHGFASTKDVWLRKYPLYTADSSTWMSGGRYGVTVVFQNGRLRHYDHSQKEVRKRFRKTYDAFGVDWKKIEADDFETVDEVNVVAWLQFAEYLHSRPGKDYWDKEVNGAPIGSFGPIRVGGVPFVESMPPQDITEGEEEEMPRGKAMDVVPEKYESCDFDGVIVEENEVPAHVEAAEPKLSKALMPRNGPVGPDQTPRTVPVTSVVKEKGPNQFRILQPNGISREEMGTAFLQCNNCLTPETPVLYSDYVWRPIGGVSIGDELLAFDERPDRWKPRKFRKSIVEAVILRRSETMRLITQASEVKTTPHHLWLASPRGNPSNSDWFQASSLTGRIMRQVGMYQASSVSDDYRVGYLQGITLGDGTFRYAPGQGSNTKTPQAYWRVALTESDEAALGRIVSYLAALGIEAHIRGFSELKQNLPGFGQANPMKKVECRALGTLEKLHNLLGAELNTDSYRRGFLAGFFDAEGSGGVNLRVHQYQRAPLDRFQRYANQLGFRFYFEDFPSAQGFSLRLGSKVLGEHGRLEQLKFFSLCQPSLMRRAQLEGVKIPHAPDKVVALELGPVLDVLDIQTSTGTFYAGGLATHNCYVQDRCKFFEADQDCHFKLANTFSSSQDIVNAMRFVMEAQMNRVSQALYQEQMDGGVIDRNLSVEMDRMTGMMISFKELLRPDRDEIRIGIEAKGAGSGGIMETMMAALRGDK